MRTHRRLSILTVVAMVTGVLAIALSPRAATAADNGDPGPTPKATAADDNGKIAFIRAGGLPTLWTMDSDGRNQRHILADGYVYSASWSPDGTQLVAETSDGVVTLNADGTGVTDLGLDPGASDPVWVRAGDIAYLAGGDIWVIRQDGPMNVTTTPDITESGVAWSPTRPQIAYTRDGDVWVLDLEGTFPWMNLTVTDGAFESSPSWSPDGRQIAYRSMVGFDPTLGSRTVDVVGNTDIWVMDADGRNQVNLTPTEPAWEGDPAWSPDGQRIAFIRDPDPNSHGDTWFQSIWTMDPDGSDQVELTDEILGDRLPAWQPLPGPHAIGMMDPATGIWHLRRDGIENSFYYGDPGDTPMLGDWDCDGEATPGLYRRSDGYVYLRNSNTQGIADVKYFFGDPGDVPLGGDFDGDGCATVSLYRPAEGKVYIHNQLGSGDEGLGAAEVSYFFGDPGDAPFAGDFDGDGIDTIGLHREATGKVYFRNTHTQGIADAEFIFGDPGDRFVAGDWLDLGTDTPAVFRPSATTWFFRYENDQGAGDASIAFGESDWLPVAGDFTVDAGPEAWIAANYLFRADLDDACDAVFPVPRLISVDRPSYDFISGPVIELLEGPTAAENAAGYTSWFSEATAGAFQGIGGDLTEILVDLADLRPVIPNASSSCGALGILAQLERTSRQYQMYASDCVFFSFDGDRDAFYDWLGLEGTECDP